MPYNPNIHNRQSIRLKGYDYSQQGLYFITICCQDRECLFGKIENEEMAWNGAGEMINAAWQALPERFHNIQMHEFIAMPNHFHGILEILEPSPVGAPLVGAQREAIAGGQKEKKEGQPQGTAHTEEEEEGQPQGTAHTEEEEKEGQPQGIAPTKTIGDMMDAFKSITTVEYIRGVKNLGWPPFNGRIWQRNYYEHIIRDEQAYINIADYIINNPAKWSNDKFFKL